MGNFLKKNWFVSLLIVVFAVISVYYIYDTNKGKLKGKTADGEDVVYEVNGDDITASEFYDSLYKNNGGSALYRAFASAVTKSVDTTDEMKSEAQSQASQIISNYYSQYGSSYQSTLPLTTQRPTSMI